MKTSKYEQKIIDILKSEGIAFEREKTFKGLGGKSAPYRFDFYVPSMNTVIECQGEQHYRHVVKFHKTWADFKKAQERDRRKIVYCLENEITYCAIPYWEMQKPDFALFAHEYANGTLKRVVPKKYIARNRWHNDQAAERS